MYDSPVALGLAAGILLSIGAADARAELIQWSYSWSRSPAQVSADSPGTGFVSLTNDGLHSAAGTSFLVATNLQAHSTASSAKPDTFINRTYSLTLFLMDQDSQKGGTISFNGEFNGTLTADSSNLTNTFVGPTTQTLQLGDHLFTVKIGPFSAPGPTGAVNSGSIAATAQVTVSTIFNLPEPSGFVLALVGISCWTLTRRRRQ